MAIGVPNLNDALRQAHAALAANPAEAASQARAILRMAPNHPGATLLLSRALRRQGDAARARKVITPLARTAPRDGWVQFELGETLAALGRRTEAIAAYRLAVAARPDLATGWRALGELLFAAGEATAADAAFGRYMAAPITEPLLAQAAGAIQRDNPDGAEPVLRRHLAEMPHDVKALGMLADILLRRRAYLEAAVLLERVLERHPGDLAARHGRAFAHQKLGQPAQGVIADLGEVLAAKPDNVDARILMGGALASLGDAEGAAAAFEAALDQRPDDPALLVEYGEQLKYAGRREEAIAAFQRAIEAAPRHGEAWFRLGDIKTYRFSPAEEVRMWAILASEGLADDARAYLCYAVAQARDAAGDAAGAFIAYESGASWQRSLTPYDPEDLSRFTRRCEALITPAFFAARAGSGRPDDDAIFIVGLPRSGSTLVEQILASHSQVEGTTELPYMAQIAQRLTLGPGKRVYPDCLASLGPGDGADLGEAYLEAAAAHRRLGRPRFIDKQPENFQHVPLIHLALPRARIIDVRRHPMASGLAIFRQHFGAGRPFSYDLTAIGRLYRDYLAQMACWDRALPGRVHRLIYEDLVNDPETEIRRLLDYCGLPFEEACLNFHASPRAVMTPSAEQVRRPIFREGLEQWRTYEPWLGPLKAALGPALETWRA